MSNIEDYTARAAASLAAADAATKPFSMRQLVKALVSVLD